MRLPVTDPDSPAACPDALRSARRASGFANLIGAFTGCVGLAFAAIQASFRSPMGMVTIGMLGLAVAILFLSYHTRRLRLWAIVGLLAITGLMTMAYAVPLFLDAPRLTYVIQSPFPVAALLVLLGVIFNCVTTLRHLARSRRTQPRGFAVEPATPVRSARER